MAEGLKVTESLICSQRLCFLQLGNFDLLKPSFHLLHESVHFLGFSLHRRRCTDSFLFNYFLHMGLLLIACKDYFHWIRSMLLWTSLVFSGSDAINFNSTVCPFQILPTQHPSESIMKQRPFFLANFFVDKDFLGILLLKVSSLLFSWKPNW